MMVDEFNLFQIWMSVYLTYTYTSKDIIIFTCYIDLAILGLGT